MTVLAHISDLHFGAHEPPLVEDLANAIAQIAPDLVAVSGDLTQRARSSQFREARAFLDSLPAPWLAVPGNHDVPLYDLGRRVFAPRAHFDRFIDSDPAPLKVLPGLRVLGLDSTRRRTSGRLTPQRLEAVTRLGEGPETDLRVLVTHHPLVRNPLAGHVEALEAAALARADLLLAGHFHWFHQLRIEEDPGLGILTIQAGTATSHRRREREPANTFNVIRATPTHVDVELWCSGPDGFAAREPLRVLRNGAPTPG